MKALSKLQDGLDFFFELITMPDSSGTLAASPVNSVSFANHQSCFKMFERNISKRLPPASAAILPQLSPARPETRMRANFLGFLKKVNGLFTTIGEMCRNW
jgi:hypothetical protein